MADKKNKKTILDTLGESQVWKSIIRSGVPDILPIRGSTPGQRKL